MKAQYGKAVKKWGEQSLDDDTLAALQLSMGEKKFALYLETINPAKAAARLAETTPAPQESPVQIFESLFPNRSRPTYDTTKRGFAKAPLLTPTPVTASSLAEWHQLYGDLKADAGQLKSLEQVSCFRFALA
jgi:hypothetical protein